jgi:hypothetical protein
MQLLKDLKTDSSAQIFLKKSIEGIEITSFGIAASQDYSIPDAVTNGLAIEIDNHNTCTTRKKLVKPFTDINREIVDRLYGTTEARLARLKAVAESVEKYIEHSILKPTEDVFSLTKNLILLLENADAKLKSEKGTVLAIYHLIVQRAAYAGIMTHISEVALEKITKYLAAKENLSELESGWTYETNDEIRKAHLAEIDEVVRRNNLGHYLAKEKVGAIIASMPRNTSTSLQDIISALGQPLKTLIQGMTAEGKPLSGVVIDADSIENILIWAQKSAEKAREALRSIKKPAAFNDSEVTVDEINLLLKVTDGSWTDGAPTEMEVCNIAASLVALENCLKTILDSRSIARSSPEISQDSYDGIAITNAEEARRAIDNIFGATKYRLMDAVSSWNTLAKTELDAETITFDDLERLVTIDTTDRDAAISNIPEDQRPSTVDKTLYQNTRDILADELTSPDGLLTSTSSREYSAFVISDCHPVAPIPHFIPSEIDSSLKAIGVKDSIDARIAELKALLNASPSSLLDVDLIENDASADISRIEHAVAVLASAVDHRAITANSSYDEIISFLKTKNTDTAIAHDEAIKALEPANLQELGVAAVDLSRASIAALIEALGAKATKLRGQACLEASTYLDATIIDGVVHFILEPFHASSAENIGDAAAILSQKDTLSLKYEAIKKFVAADSDAVMGEVLVDGKEATFDEHIVALTKRSIALNSAYAGLFTTIKDELNIANPVIPETFSFASNNVAADDGCLCDAAEIGQSFVLARQTISLGTFSNPSQIRNTNMDPAAFALGSGILAQIDCYSELKKAYEIIADENTGGYTLARNALVDAIVSFGEKPFIYLGANELDEKFPLIDTLYSIAIESIQSFMDAVCARLIKNSESTLGIYANANAVKRSGHFDSLRALAAYRKNVVAKELSAAKAAVDRSHGFIRAILAHTNNKTHNPDKGTTADLNDLVAIKKYQKEIVSSLTAAAQVKNRVRIDLNKAVNALKEAVEVGDEEAINRIEADLGIVKKAYAEAVDGWEQADILSDDLITLATNMTNLEQWSALFEEVNSLYNAWNLIEKIVGHYHIAKVAHALNDGISNRKEHLLVLAEKDAVLRIAYLKQLFKALTAKEKAEALQLAYWKETSITNLAIKKREVVLRKQIDACYKALTGRQRDSDPENNNRGLNTLILFDQAIPLIEAAEKDTTRKETLEFLYKALMTYKLVTADSYSRASYADLTDDAVAVIHSQLTNFSILPEEREAAAKLITSEIQAPISTIINKIEKYENLKYLYDLQTELCRYSVQINERLVPLVQAKTLIHSQPLIEARRQVNAVLPLIKRKENIIEFYSAAAEYVKSVINPYANECNNEPTAADLTDRRAIIEDWRAFADNDESAKYRSLLNQANGFHESTLAHLTHLKEIRRDLTKINAVDLAINPTVGLKQLATEAYGASITKLLETAIGNQITFLKKLQLLHDAVLLEHTHAKVGVLSSPDTTHAAGVIFSEGFTWPKLGWPAAFVKVFSDAKKALNDRSAIVASDFPASLDPITLSPLYIGSSLFIDGTRELSTLTIPMPNPLELYDQLFEFDQMCNLSLDPSLSNRCET